MISCLLIAAKYDESLRSSVDSFLKQDFDGERELIIFSTNPRIKLVCNQPNVRVANAVRPCDPADAKNTAISMLAKGDKLVTWSEDDYYLPNHLSTIAAHFDKDFVWLEKMFDIEGDKIARISQASTATLAFTKKAWLMAGKFHHGVVGERSFIGKVTQACQGEKVSLTPDKITFIRCGTDLEKRRQRPMATGGQLILEPQSSRDYVTMAKVFAGGTSENKICVVELGRNGDLVNILPILKIINDSYAKPHIGVAKEFVGLFDGISYATPVVLADKEEMLGDAIAKARRDFSIVLNFQVWGRGHTQHKTQESYNKESWNNAGMLHRFYDASLRPVFDRRNPEREAALLAKIPDTGKPWILVNVHNGKSSPCPECPQLLPKIIEWFGAEYQIVNLAELRAERLFDMLCLFEKAAACCSIDTVWLHAASATNCPVVALVNNKPNAWAASIVRVNCAASIPYEDALADPEKVHKAIECALLMPNDPLPAPPTVKPRERRVFNLIDRFDDSPESAARKAFAIRSQDDLYEVGKLIPLQAWPSDYRRNAQTVLGDKRPLPFLKDLLQKFIDLAEDDDICCWTNDDSILNAAFAEYAKFHCSVYHACSFFRSEFRAKCPSLSLPAELFGKMSVRKHIGRDAFSFSKKWLSEHFDEIPNFVLGAPNWDLCMAMIIRLSFGIKTTNENLGTNIFPADAPNGYCGHIAHPSTWNFPDRLNSPSNVHNGKLLRAWAEKYLPELKFRSDNNLAVKC